MEMSKERLEAVEQIIAQWRQDGVRNVRFELPDMHGTSRSKLVPIDAASGYARDGLNMYGGTVVLDTRSDVVPGTLYNEEIGYADQALWPDPETAAIVPWAPATARFICDTTLQDGRPLGAAPRHVLRRVLDRAAEHGLEAKVGIEYEFYLLDRQTKATLFDGYHIFNTSRNTWVPVIEKIVEEMQLFGIEIITANCEYAGSQWEINYRPALGMTAADQAFSFKNGVKEIARSEGLLATFMSKPFSDSAGSGAHTHISLILSENGENAMWDPEDEFHLSRLGRHFVAGQLAHAPSIYGLLAPTVNCLRRRRRHTFSPTNVSWGVEDRSAFIRLKGSSAGSLHVEDRAPSAMANPYLATAALVGAGLLGIVDELELEPPAHPPAEEDPSKPGLPTTSEECLTLLENDGQLAELLGDEFLRAYTTMRRYELARLAAHVTDWEKEEYLEMY